MKIVVSSSELLKKLNVIGKVINSKNTLPILDNFLFSFKDGELTVSASDLDSTLKTKVTLDRSEGDDGNIAIPAKILLDILKEFSEQPLSFEMNMESSTINIVSETGKFTIYAQNGNEYPQPQQIDTADSNKLTLAADIMVSGIEKTLSATSTDELRPIMNGIYVDMFPDNIKFIASDTHRLIRYTRSDVQPGFESSFILPQKPSSILKLILSKEKGDFEIVFDKYNAYFKTKEYDMVCRLYEGKYPAYESVIPKESAILVDIDRLSLYNALKRVALFSNHANKLVRLDIASGSLTISCQDMDYSISGTEKVKCELSGNPITIGFKSDFLIDMLANTGTPEVKIQLTEASRPGLVTPIDNENSDEDILMLLMPMMV